MYVFTCRCVYMCIYMLYLYTHTWTGVMVPSLERAPPRWCGEVWLSRSPRPAPPLRNGVEGLPIGSASNVTLLRLRMFEIKQPRMRHVCSLASGLHTATHKFSCALWPATAKVQMWRFWTFAVACERPLEITNFVSVAGEALNTR